MTTWHAVQGGSGEHGAVFTEYRCVEYPRLTRMIQRANAEGEFFETYHVDGIGNYFHDEQAAIRAMRANPEVPA